MPAWPPRRRGRRSRAERRAAASRPPRAATPTTAWSPRATTRPRTATAAARCRSTSARSTCARAASRRSPALGYCHMDRKEFGPAQASFRAALGISPRFGDAIIGLAEAYRFQGQNEQALETVQALPRRAAERAQGGDGAPAGEEPVAERARTGARTRDARSPRADARARTDGAARQARRAGPPRPRPNPDLQPSANPGRGSTR